MSLDVYLHGPEQVEHVTCSECGHARDEQRSPCLYSANITHNLHRMASEAGIGDVLWNPEDIGIETARQLIEPLRAGLALLKSDPPRFQKFNAPNGWGLYEHFVPFVEAYLVACEEHPDAAIRVSR